MKKFLQEFRVEITAILIAALGVFLLVEQLEIRAAIRSISIWLYQTLKDLILGGLTDLAAYITSFTVSDFIGWIIIILTSSFVIWRLRYRFLRSRHWLIEDCPRCNKPIHRVHRTRWQRFVTWFLLPHGRHYRCQNETCNWSGLRQRKHGKHNLEPEEIVDL